MDTEQLSYHIGIHPSNVSRTIQSGLLFFMKGLGYQLSGRSTRNSIKQYLSILNVLESLLLLLIVLRCSWSDLASSLKPRAQTWSNYKQHNTCKFLIGITPQGSISFVSQGWGGRVSNVHLTENCGILENLLHGDLVIADRGFKIQNAASNTWVK